MRVSVDTVLPLVSGIRRVGSPSSSKRFPDRWCVLHAAVLTDGHTVHCGRHVVDNALALSDTVAPWGSLTVMVQVMLSEGGKGVVQSEVSV